jgi:hypothetical protein
MDGGERGVNMISEDKLAREVYQICVDSCKYQREGYCTSPESVSRRLVIAGLFDRGDITERQYDKMIDAVGICNGCEGRTDYERV